MDHSRVRRRLRGLRLDQGEARARKNTSNRGSTRSGNRQPLDEVWPEIQKLLAENSYPLVGKDAEAVGESHFVLFSLFSPAKETEPDGSGGRVLENGWRKD